MIRRTPVAEVVDHHKTLDISVKSCSLNPKMSKPVGFSGLKSFDQFKSSLGSSSSATAKSFQISTRQPSYSNSSGSFANLKLTAGFSLRRLRLLILMISKINYFILCD